MLNPDNPVAGNWSPFSVRANPEVRMNLVFRDHFALYNVSHQKVVIHGLGNNLRHGNGIKFEECVVFRFPSLRTRWGAMNCKLRMKKTLKTNLFIP